MNASTEIPDVVAAAQDRLRRAELDGIACSPVRDLLGSEDVTAAYAVQRLGIQRRVAGGARVVGRKIGLTAPAVQAQLGVDQPDFGVLLDDMDVSAAAVVPTSRLLQPKVEAEIAFVLAEDLDGDVVPERIRKSVDHAVAALEVVDSRIAGWDITIADTIADNASSGLFVLGERRLTLAEFEPREVRMRCLLDDQVVSEGTGADCLGDPLEALMWLARAARDHGDPLRAGQVVLSGALGPMIPVPAGASVRAELTGFGAVSAVFDASSKEQ